MTLFIVLAAVMIVVACTAVLLPLLRKEQVQSIERDASNIAIIRDQLAELDADLAAGAISAAQHAQARAELTRRVLEEGQAGGSAEPASPRRATGVAVAMLVIIPLAAVALYAWLGQPAAINGAPATATAESAPHISPEQMAALADKLKEKLLREPDHPEGWMMLGRTYYVLQRYPEAVQAYEQAVQRMPDNADLLADYADTLAVVQGRSLEGKPRAMIERALKVNPSQWKALALAGTAAFDRKDYEAAVGYWERMKASVPPNSDMAKSIDDSIMEARGLARVATIAGGVSATNSNGPGNRVAPNAPASPNAAASPSIAAAPAQVPGKSDAGASASARVSGTVSLSPAMAAQAKSDDLVFIFARPAEGSRMPLAFLRKQVKDLPATFALDDTTAMAPTMKLSDHQYVIVGARVSRSGDVMPHSGDFEGLSKPVKVGTSGIAVVIDTIVAK